MNPIFTLNYPELVVAERLQMLFKKSEGYSTMIPLSAQQKGYDFALMRRTGAGSKIVTFQVKSSRTYQGTPGTAPRSKLRTFSHYMWLNRFVVPQEADFFLILGLYARNPTSLKSSAKLWQSHILLFKHAEMTSLMASVRQRRANKADNYFGFGFDNPEEAFLTRGHAEADHPDYSNHILTKRQHLISQSI